MARVARLTEQSARIKAVLESVGQPLAKASREVGYGARLNDEQKTEVARQLALASQEALKELKVTFEDPKRQEAAKHYLTRLKNLTKMIGEYARAETWEKLEPILKKQQTKAKAVHEKFYEYAQEVEGLVAYFDTEQEDTIRVGPWTVSLFTSKNADWDSSKVAKLQHVLAETTKILKSVGVGHAAGGKVWAYPTETLPGAASSHGALASYKMSNDTMALSAEGNVSEVLHSLVHESGHRVYFRTLSSNARDEWKAFFEAESGPPDVDAIIQEWEAFTKKPDDWEAQKYGRFSPYFGRELKKTNPEMFMWVDLIFTKLPTGEKFDQYTGSPKKGTKSGLDVLIENKAKIKVFLHPVTAYSGKNAEELFAEVFAAYAIDGPGRVPEIVMDVFKRVLPQLRTASEHVGSASLSSRVAAMYWARCVMGDSKTVWLVRNWDNHTEYLGDCVWPVAASELAMLVNGTSLMRRGNPQVFKTESSAMREFERRMRGVDATQLKAGFYRHMHSDGRIIYVSVPDNS